VVIVLVAIGIALIGCANPALVQKAKEKPTTETPVESAEETAPLVGTVVKDSNGDYALEFPLPESNGRSLVNYPNAVALQQDINYYQLVLVDDAEPEEIWAASSISDTSHTNRALRVAIKLNTTYHLLLLHGYKDPNKPTDPPLLLGSGYIRYKIGTTGGR
jgi:hypothetical protein